MRIYPPHIFALSLIAIGLLAWFLPVAPIVSGPFRMLGIIPVITGLIIAIWPSILYKRRKNPILPDATPQVLILDGPFRFTRNPMYLGMVLVLLGVAIMSGSVTPYLVLPVFVLVITRRYIRMEEANLTRQFGDDYLAYTKRVRRWI